MQVTQEELLHEAAEMALAIRLLEKRTSALEAENTRLRAALAGYRDEPGPAQDPAGGS